MPMKPSSSVAAAEEPLAGPRGVGGWLLLFVVGCFVATAVNLPLGLGMFPALISSRPYNFMVALLGAVTGLALVASRRRSAVHVARFYLAAGLVGSIVVAVVGLKPPPGYEVSGHPAWVGVGQALLVNLIWQAYFSRSRRVRATYTGAVDPQSMRRYSMLFDRRDGINLLLGVAYVLATFSSEFTWRLVAAGAGEPGSSPFYPPAFYVTQLVTAVLGAAALLFLSYSVRRDWLVPLLFGVAVVVLGIGRRAALGAMHLEGLPAFPPFALRSMVFSFAWGFLFLAGVVCAVRLWGVRVWSLMAGLVIAMLLDTLFVEAFNALTRTEYSFSLGPTDFVTAVLDGALAGGLVFAGLALHSKRQGSTHPGSVGSS
jgi:hypothetical protein